MYHVLQCTFKRTGQHVYPVSHPSLYNEAGQEKAGYSALYDSFTISTVIKNNLVCEAK